jgi:hypothetical protein
VGTVVCSEINPKNVCLLCSGLPRTCSNGSKSGNRKVHGLYCIIANSEQRKVHTDKHQNCERFFCSKTRMICCKKNGTKQMKQHWYETYSGTKRLMLVGSLIGSKDSGACFTKKLRLCVWIIFSISVCIRWLAVLRSSKPYVRLRPKVAYSASSSIR